MNATTTTIRSGAERGSALLIALVMTMSLAAIVTYAVSDTMDSHANAKREDNTARSLSAAEYGAELAISEIGRNLHTDDEVMRDRSKIIGDFVSGRDGNDFYRNTVDQRRIRGIFDNQEFRVRIRSARHVYTNLDDSIAGDLARRGWLKPPANYDIPLGKISAREFRDMYEVTSTARHGDMSRDGVPVRPELMGQSTVQAVVRLDWKSPLGDMLERIGLIHMEKPSRFQPRTGKTLWHDYYAKAGSIPAANADGSIPTVPSAAMPTTEVFNLTATGEDHYLTKFIRSITEQSIITIIQPWKLYTNEMNFFGAAGAYWEDGNLTLNYKMPKDSNNDNNLKARDLEPVNPYRPRLIQFKDTYSDYTYKWNLKRSQSGYPYPLRDDFKRSTPKDDKEFQAMQVLDKNTPYDTYLLGGKEGNNLTGKTVQVVDPDVEFFDGVKGRIKEVRESESEEGGKFDVVLGNFSDLRNIYANLAGASNRDGSANMFNKPSQWKQIYLGQYSHKPRLSSPNRYKDGDRNPGVRQESLPLLSGNRIRPQTLHTLMNDKNQFLVRLYSLEIDGKTVYYKYPATVKVKLEDGEVEEPEEVEEPADTGPAYEETGDGRYIVHLPFEDGYTFKQLADGVGRYTNQAFREKYLPWGGSCSDQAKPYYLDQNWNYITPPWGVWWKQSYYGEGGRESTVVPKGAIRAVISRQEAEAINLFGGSSGGGGNQGSGDKPGPGQGVGTIAIQVPFTDGVSYTDLNNGNKNYHPLPCSEWFPWGGTMNKGYWDSNYNWVINTWSGWENTASNVKDHKVPMHKLLVYVTEHQLAELRKLHGDDAIDEALLNGAKYKYRKAEWTGLYVWADAKFGSLNGNDEFVYTNDDKLGSGFKLVKTVAGEKDRGEGIETLAVPRIFFWQELMGYSLVKRRDSAGYGYPATYENNERDGDKRTYFANSSNGQAMTLDARVKVGFDELYQGTTEEGKKHPLFDRLKAKESDIQDYVQDRFDPIHVLEYDKSLVVDSKGEIHGYDKPLDESNRDIKEYKELNDFLFPHDFEVATEDGGGFVTRQAVKIFVGFEDQTELGSEWGPTDYDYADLTFTIWIAPPELVEHSSVVSTSMNQQLDWWERPEEDGLTGLRSNYALTANNEMGAGRYGSRDSRLLDNYGKLGHVRLTDDDSDNPDDYLFTHMWTMLDREEWYRLGFAKAMFLREGDRMVFNESDPLVQAYLEKAAEENVTPVFYFTNADRAVYETLRPEEEQGTELDNAAFKAILKAAYGYTFKPVMSRWPEQAEKKRQELRALLVDTKPSSMNIPDDDVYARDLAKGIVGSEELTVPTVTTENYSPITGATREETTKVLLAGEPRPKYDEGDFIGFDQNDVVPVSTRKLAIPDYFGDTTRDVPDPRDNEESITEPFRLDSVLALTSVEDAYQEHAYPPEVGRQDIRKKFGLKDRRYSLGYHRGGDYLKLLTNPAIAEGDYKYFADHYTFAYLHKPGWNPFMLASDGTAVANELQPKDDENDPNEASRYDLAYKYGLDHVGNDTPRFVFDKHFDGAGAMVVNGDLVIQDTFAYHGILIVLGDVIVEPTVHRDEFIWSGSGWPVDKDNNPLMPKDMNAPYARIADPDYDRPGNWVYVDEEEKGDVPRPANPLPLRADVVRGELHVQGQLIVKGRLTTRTVRDNDSGKEYTGRINAYWSEDAVSTIGGIWSVGKVVVDRVSWTHDDDIDVGPIWADVVEQPTW